MSRLLRLLAPVLLVPVFHCAGAEGLGPEPSGELTLQQAITAAMARNPELSASEFDLRAADAQVTQAGLRPNPELAVEFENFGGGGAASGADTLETTLRLGQVLELGGKRARRIDVARAGLDVTTIERQAQQLDLLADVSRRFIDVVAAQESLALADESVRLAERTLSAISTRVDAARSPEAERRRAVIALTRARLDAQRAETALKAARNGLAATWGSSAPAFQSARANLFRLQDVGRWDELLNRLQQSPDFLRFASAARLREAELRLAQAEIRPDLRVEAGLRRFEETNDQAFVAGFSLPLPVWNRNQGAIREAEIRRGQVRVAERAAWVRAQAILSALYAAVRSAGEAVRTLREQALPQAEAALELTQSGYERGRFSYLELAAAQQDLLDVQRDAIAFAADAQHLVVEIERLTNAPLVADSTEQTTESPKP